MSLVRPDTRPARQPDLPFAAVLGSYVAAFVVSVGVIVGAVTLGDWRWSTIAALLVGGLAFAPATVLAFRSEGIAERLGRARWAWLLAALPLCWFVLVAAVTRVLDVAFDGASLLLGMGTAPLVSLVGLGVAAMATNRYVEWALAGANTEAVWSAPWPVERRRRIRVGAGLVFLVGIGVIVVGAVLDRGAVELLGQLALLGSAVLFLAGKRQRYRATDKGLEVRSSALSRRVYEWSSFEGFRLTADAMILDRREPWQPSLRCDLDAIDDRDAVVDVLESHLTRRG